MIKTKEIEKTITETEVESASCSFCGKIFDKTTCFCNGFGKIHIGFGFGSCFDDCRFSLQICDECFVDKFYNLEEIKNQIQEIGLTNYIVEGKYKDRQNGN